MAAITVYATANSIQNGIIVTDETNWSQIGGSISDMTDIIISLYGDSETSIGQYQLSSDERTTYITTGSIEVLFQSLVGNESINDGWYYIKVTSNSGSFVSGYSGFGIYSSIKYAVFSEIDGLHVPEDNKYNIERYCTMAMWIEGLAFLCTSNINSRGVKFTKRLYQLQKMLLKI